MGNDWLEELVDEYCLLKKEVEKLLDDTWRHLEMIVSLKVDIETAMLKAKHKE
jgi:hypothetical protein